MPNLCLLAPLLSTLLLLPGGYAVLKGVQEGMKLPSSKMLASFASLRDYGNTSCSTTWYVLAYLETCEKVKRGQTVMQVRGRAATGDSPAICIRPPCSCSWAQQGCVLRVWPAEARRMLHAACPRISTGWYVCFNRSCSPMLALSPAPSQALVRLVHAPA